MELNEGTLQVLKNFSGINQNLLIRSGNTIKTISEARNVLATAIVDQELTAINCDGHWMGKSQQMPPLFI